MAELDRIAHLSDVHLLDPKTHKARARYRFATKLVSLGRPIDPLARASKLLRALGVAKASGARHFVISGDLTEIGSDAEFELMAEVLHDAGLPPDSVTLVPGNHDAYTTRDGWRRALEGPLEPFAAASAGAAGKVIDRGDVAFLPIDATLYQSVARSGGHFTRAMAAAVERRLRDPALENKAIVLVQHHPPFAHGRSALWQWIDGLRGYARLLDLLVMRPRVQILHGHLHRMIDRIVGLGKNRVFGAPATCDDPSLAPRVRLYDVRNGALVSAGLCAT